MFRSIRKSFGFPMESSREEWDKKVTVTVADSHPGVYTVLHAICFQFRVQLTLVQLEAAQTLKSRVTMGIFLFTTWLPVEIMVTFRQL